MNYVYGNYIDDTSVEHAIRNRWARDVLGNEREFQFYQTQYVTSTILMLLTHKSEQVLEMHKKFTSLCFPWETPEKPGAVNLEAAIQKFKEMQASSRIQDVKKNVEVTELFEKWEDPLQAEEPK